MLCVGIQGLLERLIDVVQIYHLRGPPKNRARGWIWLDMAGFHGGSWDLSGISMGFYLKKSGTQAFWVERRCYNQQNRGKSS